MPLTKRNHFNPCFWTAHWNAEYFASALAGRRLPYPRRQLVHVLNLVADKVLQDRVENVHYETGLGLVRITKAMLADYATEAGLNDEESRSIVESYDGDLTLDYESQWRAQEALPPYQEVMRLIADPSLTIDAEMIAWLGCFIAMHYHRNQSVILSTIELFERFQKGKLLVLSMLRQAMIDTKHLDAIVGGLCAKRWTIYQSPIDMLPLGDNAILNRADKLSIALSPRMLLEIDKTQPWSGLRRVSRISRRLAGEYRRWCISNSTRHIIFSSPELLKDWRGTHEYRARRQLLAQKLSLIQEINVPGHGRVLKTNVLDNVLTVKDALRGPPAGELMMPLPPR